MTDRGAVRAWIEGYERAWRSPAIDALDGLFTATVSYSPSPWSEPLVGLEQVRGFWESAREGPSEGFRMTTEIVAVDGDTAVVRVDVAYDDGQRWRDLWVMRFDSHGRCTQFEEWPFAPDQPDGHEGDIVRSDAD